MTAYAPTSPLVRPVTAGDHTRAGGVLARAFDDDPIARWMTPSKPLDRSFHFDMRRLWLPHGGVYETADGRAVAVWLPPGKAHMSLIEQLRVLPGLAAAVGRDLSRVLSATGLIEKDHTHEDHWYLNMVGAVPSAQGRGYGSALLARTLERIDAEGMPAYLDATTERSRGLYERHGFEVTEEVRLPKGGPPFWRMWRERRG